MGDKYEKDSRTDHTSFKSLIPRITNFDIEKQIKEDILTPNLENFNMT